jgi:histidinol phosphatase-like enzyme (inositol monophosphatase family)
MRLSAAEKAEIVKTAHMLADAARLATLEHFRTEGLTAENKVTTHFDPVTIADRAAEKSMREILSVYRPSDAILGEEFGASVGTSGLTWVLDPIDGTRGYMSGSPTWGVLISIADTSGPIFGIIDQPYIGERFWGGFGDAGVAGPLGQKALKTREPRRLSDAVLYTTFPEVGSPEEGAAFAKVKAKSRLTRYGLDCYAYALIAAGQVDLVIEAGLQPYDVQAPIAVIEAAGGIVTNWQGGQAHQGGRVLAAANREIHAEALAVLNS